MILVYGVDIFNRSAMASMLNRELSNAGFRGLKVIKEKIELAFQDPSYVLAFGAQVLKDLELGESMKENRGCFHLYGEHLVFTTYSPGFIHHNKASLPLLQEDLRVFHAAIKLDRDGILV